jgi:serine/threonine protein kinase
MKLAENGSLAQYLKSRRYGDSSPLQTATGMGKLICDIVLGMKYVHSRGIIHQDLKPGNIFLDEHWRGMIGDFGQSRERSVEASSTCNEFTPAYAAPEQLAGVVHCTDKVDVFAFGVIVYELLERGPVAEVPGRANLPNPPDNFGPLMQDVVRRCWSRNPSNRPSFAGIFAAFTRCEFSILPFADSEAIKQSVSEVTKFEKTLVKGKKNERT